MSMVPVLPKRTSSIRPFTVLEMIPSFLILLGVGIGVAAVRERVPDVSVCVLLCHSVGTRRSDR